MSISPTPMTTKLPPFPAGPPQELLLSSAFLIKRLGMMIKESSLAALEPTGLTPQHHAVLTLLDEGMRETQGEIADTLGYDRSHLVGLLDELEEKGYAERRRDPADRRRQLVSLTPAGKAALDRATRDLEEGREGAPRTARRGRAADAAHVAAAADRPSRPSLRLQALARSFRRRALARSYRVASCFASIPARRSVPPSVTSKPTKCRPGAPAGSSTSRTSGRPRSSRTPRCPTSGSSPVRNPVAATTASTATRLPSCEHRRSVLEARERGDDADASLLHRLRQPDVDDRDHPPLEERGVGTCGSGQPERLEIGDRDPPDPGRDPVGDARREMRARDPEQLARDAERVAPDDARRRPHRQQHLARPSLGQVDRDLGTRVAGADDEHAPPAVRRGVAVVRGVDDLDACRRPASRA